MALLEEQTDKRFLLFESQHDLNSGEETHPLHSDKSSWFWSDRLVLIKEQHDDDFWNFTAFDLLMNESRSIRFHKISKNLAHIYVYPLNENFGFIIEESSGINCVNFVKFDWGTNKFQVIESIEKQYDYLWILVDKMEPLKFVLRCHQIGRINDYQICKLVNSKIEFGEIHHPSKRVDFYSRGRFINVTNNNSLITVYELTSRNEQVFQVDQSSFDEDVVWYGPREWINERLYTNFCFNDKKEQGIAWTDLTTKRRNLVNFETNLGIYDLKFIGGNLIVNASFLVKNSGISYWPQVKFYTIPMRRPNFLRYSAWLSVVQVMKKNGEKDPYAAAKEFLPLNSDLRSPWFKDVEQIEESIKKLSI